jgi:hypothetical protein
MNTVLKLISNSALAKKSSSRLLHFRAPQTSFITTAAFSLRLKSSFKSFRWLQTLVAQALRPRKVEGFTSLRWKNSLLTTTEGGRIHLHRWKKAPPISGRIHPLWMEEFTPSRWKKAPPERPRNP